MFSQKSNTDVVHYGTCGSTAQNSHDAVFEDNYGAFKVGIFFDAKWQFLCLRCISKLGKEFSSFQDHVKFFIIKKKCCQQELGACEYI